MGDTLALQVTAKSNAEGVLLKVEQAAASVRNRVDQVAAGMSTATASSTRWEEGLRRLALQQQSVTDTAQMSGPARS